MIKRTLGRLTAIGAAVVLGLLLIGAAPPAARGSVSVSISMFYDSLAPHGRWVDHHQHGYVWYPTEVDNDWRPYTRGRWENTEDYGWMWVADEEWGWAPFHYGRWDFDERYGWFWVPGTEWGPAWVDWRHGDGYIGWAPLPPEVRFYGGRFDYGRVDIVSVRYRPHWVFVREVNFVQPRLYRHCLASAHNVTIIHRTNVITNYTVVNNIVINRSVNVGRIEAVTRKPVPLVKVVQVEKPHGGKFAGPAGGGARTVAVFRPAVSVDPQAKPASIAPLRTGMARPERGEPKADSAGQPGKQPQQNSNQGGARLPQAETSPTPGSIGQNRALESQTNKERRQLDREHLKERFKEGITTPSGPRPDTSQRQAQEKQELQRLQQQRRAVIQNRQELGRPQRASQASGQGHVQRAPDKGKPDKKGQQQGQGQGGGQGPR